MGNKHAEANVYILTPFLGGKPQLSLFRDTYLEIYLLHAGSVKCKNRGKFCSSLVVDAIKERRSEDEKRRKGVDRP